MSTGNVTMFRPTRSIFFYDEVDNITISKLVNYLYILDQDADDRQPEPIELHICSHGGQLEDCLDGVDFIYKWVHCPVVTICHGYAESAGFYLFMAGDKRYSDKNSILMFHNCCTEISGGTTYITQEMEQIEIQEQRLIDVVVHNSKLTKDILKKNGTGKNWYFTPTEMKKYGICTVF
jgi:ATP-dependent Clp protease protease subunit